MKCICPSILDDIKKIIVFRGKLGTNFMCPFYKVTAGGTVMRLDCLDILPWGEIRARKCSRKDIWRGEI